MRLLDQLLPQKKSGPIIDLTPYAIKRENDRRKGVTPSSEFDRLKGVVGSVPNAMSELDSKFGKRSDWAAVRPVLSKWLYTQQYQANDKGHIDISKRITGLEQKEPGESESEFQARLFRTYRVTRASIDAAERAVKEGNLEPLIAGHAQFIQAKESTKKAIADKEAAKKEQEKAAKFQQSVEALPFDIRDYQYSKANSDVVRIKPGTVVSNKYPGGAMPIEDAERWMVRAGLDPMQFQPTKEGEGAAFALRGLNGPQGQIPGYRPPTEAQANEAGLKAVGEKAIDLAIDPLKQAATVLDDNATVEERLGAIGNLLLYTPVLEPFNVAKQGVKAVKAIMNTEKGWVEFSQALEKLKVPDHIKVAEYFRSSLDDPAAYNYFQALERMKKLGPDAGKGGLGEAADFASKQVGTPPPEVPVGPQEAADRFKAAMRDSERVGRPQREAAVSQQRAEQIGRLSGVRARGEAAVSAGRKARAVGEASNPDFVFKEPIPTPDREALYNAVLDHDWAGKLNNRQNALEALQGIFENGKLPQPSEIKLLEEVFGEDFGRAITGHGPTVAGNINKFAREMQLLNPWSRAFDVVSNATKFASYVALNPARSVLSSILFQNTPGRETLITPWKIRNVVKGYRKTLSTDVGEVLNGINKATGSKFEGRTGIFTKAAGLTDAPFFPLYERLAMDDYAVGAAKSMQGGVKANRDTIFKQLTEGAEGPLTTAQVNDAKALANDWALRQTYNIDNVASNALSWIKNKGASKLEAQFPGRTGRELGDFLRLGVDMNTRFSKVIGNVALDAANYVPALGLTEAGARALFGKMSGGITSKDARLIADLASKGLAGTALTAAGVALYPQLKDSDWIKGEIVATEGGTRFVRWTILPNDPYFSMDADQLPGAFKAILRGATRAMLDEKDNDGNRLTGLTDKQTEDVWGKYQVDSFVNQPILSGSSNALNVLLGERGSSAGKYAGSKTAAQIVPGGLREFAERRDEANTGVLLRKANDAPEGETPGQKFWREFFAEYYKRIPGLRESLAPNTKQQSKSKGKQPYNNKTAQELIREARAKRPPQSK